MQCSSGLKPLNDECVQHLEGACPLPWESCSPGPPSPAAPVPDMSKVKIRWTAGELEGTDWKGGWYKAGQQTHIAMTLMC